MKNKPELFKRTGKSNLTLRTFLNNLKENDLHYENKQITQCVFLGVLRLKPVPSIFSSNNVPSASAPIENTSKRIRNNNSNKELNKNVSKKNDINKVLSGKISKKNPQKVKAAVKKVPMKKSNIMKIDLSSKQKSKVNLIPTNDDQEAIIVSSESSNTLTHDSILSRPTISLNSIISPNKFNPVQNLFDKLKQKIDESHNEPGPSTTLRKTNKIREGLGVTSESCFKVCKINAKRQVNLNMSTNKRPKKVLPRKYGIRERLTMPLKSISPITISDSESTGRKDDVIVLDENDSSNKDESENQDETEEVEDVILINDHSKPIRSRERTSPRNKTVSPTQETQMSAIIEDKQSIIIINDRRSPETDAHSVDESDDSSKSSSDESSRQQNDIILISDDPQGNGNIKPYSTTQKTCKNISENDSSKEEGTHESEIIIVDEVREVRVSPRLRKIDLKEKMKTNAQDAKTTSDLVIVTDTAKEAATNSLVNVSHNKEQFFDHSKTKELSITVDQQNEQDSDGMSVSLLRTIEEDDKNSASIKNELIESNNETQDVILVIEKPRQRKHKKSPLIPPMLLNAPMLLRSELAPKKFTPGKCDKQKGKTKEKAASKLQRKGSNTREKEYSVSAHHESSENSLRAPPINQPISKNITNITLPSEDVKNNDEDVVFVPNQTKVTNSKETSSRLLRSDLVQQRNSERLSRTPERFNQEDIQEVNVMDEVKKQSVAIQIRSDLTHRKSPENSPIEPNERTDVKEEVIIVNDEETKTEEKRTSPRLLKSDIVASCGVSGKTKEKDQNLSKNKSQNVIKEELKSDENTSPRLLRSDMARSLENSCPNSKQLNPKKDVPVKGTTSGLSRSEIQTIDHQEKPIFEIIIKDEPKINKSTSSTALETNLPQKRRVGRPPKKHKVILTERCVVIDKNVVQNVRTSPRLRSDMAQNKRKPKSQNVQQIDLDEVITVNERKVKKTNEQSGDKLLGSDLVEENSPVIAELEEVIVLIHDEPKTQEEPQKCAKGYEEVSNKDVNGEEPIIVFPHETRSHATEKSPNTSAQESQVIKTPRTRKRDLKPFLKEEPVAEKEKFPRRAKNTLNEEQREKKASTSPTKLSPQTNTQRSSSTSPNSRSACSVIKEKKTSPRMLRSELALQKTPENQQKEHFENSPNTNIESPRLLRSENASNKDRTTRSLRSDASLEQSTHNLSKTSESLEDTSVTVIDESCRLSRSEALPKKSLQNISKNLCESPEVPKNKRGRKSIKKQSQQQPATKLKTPMLLRSELAQLKNIDIDNFTVEELNSSKNKKNTDPKLTNIECALDSPILENVKMNKMKAPKRKSLIDDLKKRKFCQEKSIPLSTTDNNPDKIRNTLKNPSEVEDEICENTQILKTEGNLLNETNNIEAVPNMEAKASRRGRPRKLNTVTSSKKVVPANSVQNCPKGNRKKLSKRGLKRSKEKVLENKSTCTADVQETIPDNNPGIADVPKKIGINVFDFDETEPEVLPLRLSNSPKKDSTKRQKESEDLEVLSHNEDSSLKPKKRKLMIDKTTVDHSKTKAQAKAKLLAMFHENSRQKNNLESPDQSYKDKRTKTQSASESKSAKTGKKSLLTMNQNEDSQTNKSVTKSCLSDKPNTSVKHQNAAVLNDIPKTNTSPLKQTTITDMFNKALIKKEKTASIDIIFEPTTKETLPEESLKENTGKTDMPPPKIEKKILSPSKDEEEENELYDEDDDSDCESRVEWIPEEYAEYKFKYSAKKMMNYKPIHKCKICLLILPSYYRLSKHKKEHAKMENPYNCTQCEQAFPNIEDLTAHLRIHKGKHPYTCKKCDIGFWSKKSLDAHTPIHVLRKVKQPNKRFRCDVCAKEFSKLCDMERHTRVHTGEKPCVCNICNKRFQQSHNLSKHLLTHLHVKPYHCEICNKQFGRNDVLNRHLLTHSVDKPIKCALCPKGFIRQTQLNNHMKKNHSDAAKLVAKEESRIIEAK